MTRETTWAVALAVGLWGCGGAGIAGAAGGSAADSGDPSVDAGEGDPYVDAMLTAHNAVRARAMPAPAPALAPLGWSAAAASTAQAWAEGCRFQHNPMLGRAYGENLFAGAGKPFGPGEVIDAWEGEKGDYALEANRCAAGKQCGHYTQLVWRSSTAVGCASKTCTGPGPFGDRPWTLVVCNYAPPGNVAGQRPY